MKNKLYLTVILCIILAVFFKFAGPYLSSWMASDIASQKQQQRLSMFYQVSIFIPLSLPSYPLPGFLVRLVPPNYYSFYGLMTNVFMYLQIGLLLRRIAICIRVQKIQVPSLNLGWKIVLWISLGSWLIGVLALLLPRLAFPFFGEDLVKTVRFASVYLGTFIVPFFWIIPRFFFGASFFILELLSFGKEGVFPSPNREG